MSWLLNQFPDLRYPKIKYHVACMEFPYGYSSCKSLVKNLICLSFTCEEKCIEKKEIDLKVIFFSSFLSFTKDYLYPVFVNT